MHEAEREVKIYQRRCYKRFFSSMTVTRLCCSSVARCLWDASVQPCRQMAGAKWKIYLHQTNYPASTRQDPMQSTANLHLQVHMYLSHQAFSTMSLEWQQVHLGFLFFFIFFPIITSTPGVLRGCTASCSQQFPTCVQFSILPNMWHWPCCVMDARQRELTIPLFLFR